LSGDSNSTKHRPRFGGVFVDGGCWGQSNSHERNYVQFNSSSTGDSIESFHNAEEQAKEAKNQEAPCGGSQASEEAEEAKREDGQCGRSEKTIRLAVFERELWNSKRPLRAPV